MFDPKNHMLKRNITHDAKLLTKVGASNIEINFAPDTIGRVLLGPAYIPVGPNILRTNPVIYPGVIMKVPQVKAIFEEILLICNIADYYGAFNWDLVGFSMLLNGTPMIPEEYPNAPAFVNVTDRLQLLNSQPIIVNSRDELQVRVFNENPMTEVLYALTIRMRFEKDVQ